MDEEGFDIGYLNEISQPTKPSVPVVSLLCLPPSLMGEVYYFRCHQLIFRLDRHVIYHLKGLLEYIPIIDSVCLSVPRSSNE